MAGDFSLSSPNLNSLPKASQRVKDLVGCGRAARLLRNAQQSVGKNVASTVPSYRERTPMSMSPFEPRRPAYHTGTPSSVLSMANTGSSAPGGSGDEKAHHLLQKYLSRRRTFSLIDADMVVRGRVHNKTDEAISVTLLEVYKLYESEVDHDRDSNHIFLSNLEGQEIHGECHESELSDEDGNPPDRTLEEKKRRIDRFSLGDIVNCIVVAVDVHSEKVHLSLNNTRIVNSGMYCPHNLGRVEMNKTPLIPAFPSPSISIRNNPYTPQYTPHSPFLGMGEKRPQSPYVKPPSPYVNYSTPGYSTPGYSTPGRTYSPVSLRHSTDSEMKVSFFFFLIGYSRGLSFFYFSFLGVLDPARCAFTSSHISSV